ncbi:PIN domain-containing protein [Natrarchaeobius chitinivorans]|uniref:PIN domain-containing protein n=1 Tax=Natrarchaeobius chitinivorans TaxID=1679083 RepID=A0A3N6M0Y7_NATCH|nr:PIN domain-containing protein [Natrarchaeobius chitinivorans]RQG89340.1 PIN domain-containing protein [Natrarchaeobius chitinivorans]
MYVETDFLFALAKRDDWLQDEAKAALEREDVHTSILAYAEFLVRTYDRGEGFETDAPRLVVNLLELVPVRPQAHEDALLAAATYLEEYEMTPFDALHAGIAASQNERILSSDLSYDDLDVTRVPLEPEDNGS